MLTELDLKCLQSIADDYEEIPQIKEMLKKIDDIDASEGDISISLYKLVNSKLAQAYECEESKYEFIEVEFPWNKALSLSAMDTWRPGESTVSRLWFYITRAGKDCLCANRSQLGL